MSKHNAFDPIWRFLISLRLTLFLLLILAGASIIGTVVPQKAQQVEYIRIFGENGFRVIEACRFYDLYGSWWFQLTMAFFALNLICCTLHRAPRILRAVRSDKNFPDREGLSSMGNCRTGTLAGSRSESEERITRELAAFGRPVVQRQENAVTLFAEKGRWTRLGFFLTHLAILLILGGSLLGHLGFKGFLQLYEGQQSDIVMLRDSSGTQPLDFTVRCNSFEVKFYENTGRPQSYLSSLTVLENGNEILTKEIRVNDPLIYKGVYFYQSSYGTDPKGTGTLELQIATHGGETAPARVKVVVGSSVVLPGTQDELFVDRFLPDFALDEHNHPFSRSANLNNPAALLRAERDGKPLFTSWLFARHPDFHGKQTEPYHITMTNFEPRYFTGLQVAKDPGVWFVWAGCAFLLAGMYIAFFCSHRRVWVRCEDTPDGCKVTVAGEANKHKPAFKNDFSALCGRLLG